MVITVSPCHLYSPGPYRGSARGSHHCISLTQLCMEETWRDRPHSLLGCPALMAHSLPHPSQPPGTPSLLLGEMGRKLAVSILLLGADAEITPSVAQLPFRELRLADQGCCTHHFWLRPGHWNRLGKWKAAEHRNAYLGREPCPVHPANEPATPIGPRRLRPVLRLGAMEHRNLRRGFCWGECLPECVSFPVLVWKFHATHLFTYPFIQSPQHAGHYSVARDTKMNKGEVSASKALTVEKGRQTSKQMIQYEACWNRCEWGELGTIEWLPQPRSQALCMSEHMLGGRPKCKFRTWDR